jgi:hypothetical protein
MITALFGAGFSRAISHLMPMTLELGRELRREDSNPEELARIPEIKTGADLERWLSRIAEPQPFLDDVFNALGQVDFIMPPEQSSKFWFPDSKKSLAGRCQNGW